MGELVYGGGSELEPAPAPKEEREDEAVSSEVRSAPAGGLAHVGEGSTLETAPTEAVEEPSKQAAETGTLGSSSGSVLEHRPTAAKPSRRPEGRLASEDVIINAPMSFAGAFQRTMRLRRIGGLNQKPWYVQVLWHWLILNSLLLIWWTAVAAWYLTFGLLLVPYRLLRRGARKRKAEALRHRELLDAVNDRT